MGKRTFIKVHSEIRMTHYYPGAPSAVSFLNHPHSHMFNVDAQIEVFHNDRELEFLLVEDFLKDTLEDVRGRQNDTAISCEMFADLVYNRLAAKFGWRDMVITVSEDGVASAVVIYRDMEKGILL